MIDVLSGDPDKARMKEESLEEYKFLDRPPEAEFEKDDKGFAKVGGKNQPKMFQRDKNLEKIDDAYETGFNTSG